MATNLLILTPDIPASAISFINYASTLASSPNETEDYYFYNTFRGERFQTWAGGYSDTEHSGIYDLGSGQTKTANFIVLAKLDYLQSLYPGVDVSYSLMTSSDDITYGYADVGTLSGLTLLGPEANDYAKVFTTSSAYRYWRIRLSAASSFQHKIGKIYFGTATDLEQDPETYKITRVFPDDAVFTTDSGARHLARTANSKYRLEIQWTGITDAKVKEFVDNVWAKRHSTPVFLYTQSYHDILDNQRLLHCKLIEATIDNINGIPDYNNISATFEEILG